MKTLFCDNCIRQILKTVEHQLIEELVVFDAEGKVFYPIEDETTLRTGDHCLNIAYRDSSYRIGISAVDS